MRLPHSIIRPAILALLLTLACAISAHAALRQWALKLNSPTLANQYAAPNTKVGMQGIPAYTIEAWVNPDSYLNYPTIVSNSFVHSYWVGLNTTGHVRFYPVGSSQSYFESPSVLPTGQWTHVAVTYTSGDARIYVNGNLDAQSAAFTGTAAARNVQAKTGSLRYVSSLSGYVTTAAKERLAFSFMLNAYANTSLSGREIIDDLAVQLASFSGRSDGP